MNQIQSARIAQFFLLFHSIMKSIDSLMLDLAGMKKYTGNVKIFLLVFLVVASLPIHLVTGSNIQSVIGDGVYHYMNYNKIMSTVFHLTMTLLFMVAYQTNDAILFGLLLFFNFHDTDRNKDAKDRGHWYV